MYEFYDLVCTSTRRQVQIGCLIPGSDDDFGTDAWYLTVYDCMPDGSLSSCFFSGFDCAHGLYSVMRRFGDRWELPSYMPEYPPLFPSEMVSFELEVI